MNHELPATPAALQAHIAELEQQLRLSDEATRVFQTWKDTDHRRCSRRLVRNATFFEQNVP